MASACFARIFGIYSLAFDVNGQDDRGLRNQQAYSVISNDRIMIIVAQLFCDIYIYLCDDKITEHCREKFQSLLSRVKFFKVFQNKTLENSKFRIRAISVIIERDMLNYYCIYMSHFDHYFFFVVSRWYPAGQFILLQRKLPRVLWHVSSGSLQTWPVAHSSMSANRTWGGGDGN